MNGLPLPGPTLRARVGDLVNITLLNQVDTSWFGLEHDKGEQGEGCDESQLVGPGGSSQLYPGNTGDVMPNCFHGSSTTNIHFHGTHTSPSTTGDNVLLQIRPSLRNPQGQPIVTEASVERDFADFFTQCAYALRGSSPVYNSPNAWPTTWDQLPRGYRTDQQALLRQYDYEAQWQGGRGLPPGAQLWPANQEALDLGRWPVFSVGAFPYCFGLPEYQGPPDGMPVDREDLQMGQAPGTHWYHAHKHGSTHLNVSNAMTGIFIIEGEYDDTLRRYYGVTAGTLEDFEKVLVIQQIGTSPTLRSSNRGAGVADPLSVNGQREPVLTMRPGQTQMWRIVNNAARSGVYFRAPSQSGPTDTVASEGGLKWRQTAQDGVQLAPANYIAGAGADENMAPFLLAAGNRADLLVQAPTEPGLYSVRVSDTIGRRPSNDDNDIDLLWVRVEAGLNTASPQPFPTEAQFPVLPPFLKDIDEPIRIRRELVFETFGSPQGGGARSHTINDEKFGERIYQSMLLNTVEEWTVSNRTPLFNGPSGAPIAHPFHIHINPFQVVEVFDPSDTTTYKTEPGTDDGRCYINPLDPTTWHPCDAQMLKAPFVWWDVFAIPGAIEKTRNGEDTSDDTPEDQKVLIPGYFKMRSRFVDYTGQYVMHCHILAHEDRGMMQMVEVVPDEIRGGHR